MVVVFVIPSLILLLIAVAPTWPYSRRWGYIPSGGVGVLLVATIILLFVNRTI